ncbi:DUF917 domain-containing protein [Rhodococcus sp. 27YEA15]|uniref:DUF917 domain-containing protein n=1 Tax=Rhodococcus sp. 27YEA15 TaxID=3156259 RepID=UPI003C7CD634
MVHEVELDAIAAGAVVLGCGGGGDPRLLVDMLRHLIASSGVEVLAPPELPDDALVMPVGLVGSALALEEQLPSGREFADTAEAMSRWTGRSPTAVMTFEGGGLNALSGIAAALALGVPVVDADLLGRAMPRLDHFSLAAAGLELCPVTLAQPGGLITVVDRVDVPGVEVAIRSLIGRTSGWGALALAPVDAGTVRSATVPGTLSRAHRLGEQLAMSRGRRGTAALIDARVLGSGRVRAVRKTSADTRRGNVIVEDSAAVLRVEFESEYLCVSSDGEMTATCPDIVVLVDVRTGDFVACESVHPGQDVAVLVLPGPAWWSQDQVRLDVVGPRAFGIDHDAVLTEVR